ncbi:MAG: hypothetical protein AAFV62_06050 [Pseudomonadota bacterium]
MGTAVLVALLANSATAQQEPPSDDTATTTIQSDRPRSVIDWLDRAITSPIGEQPGATSDPTPAEPQPGSIEQLLRAEPLPRTNGTRPTATPSQPLPNPTLPQPTVATTEPAQSIADPMLSDPDQVEQNQAEQNLVEQGETAAGQAPAGEVDPDRIFPPQIDPDRLEPALAEPTLATRDQPTIAPETQGLPSTGSDVGAVSGPATPTATPTATAPATTAATPSAAAPNDSSVPGAPSDPGATTAIAAPRPTDAGTPEPFTADPTFSSFGQPGPNDPSRVEVGVVPNVSGAAVGTMSAQASGLPVDAWRGTTMSDALKQIGAAEPTDIRAANRLAITLLTATFEAPEIVRGGVRDFFDTRLNALLRYGAADEAASLASARDTRQGLSIPAFVPATLLGGEETLLCMAVAAQPQRARSIDPGLPIFCKVAEGARDEALLAIDLARTFQEGDPALLDMLAAAAEPAFTPPNLSEIPAFSGAPDATSALFLAAALKTRQVIPPDLAGSAALGQLWAMTALGSGADLAPRVRLTAFERLERAGSLPTDTLAEAFATTRAAESGGVWGRVEAFRSVVAAAPDRLNNALSAAADRAREGGHLGGMLRSLGLYAPIGPALSANRVARDALRLVGRAPEVSVAMTQQAGPVVGDADERALQRVADPRFRPASSQNDITSLLARAVRGEAAAGRVLAALFAFGLEIPQPGLFAPPPGGAFADEQSPASRAFDALLSLRTGSEVQPEPFYHALSTLVAVGLEPEAREIAVEVLTIGQ